MAVPVSQMWTVASYVLRQKLAGRKRYPLVLMLEPLFRCNLACAGCGKIQYPAHILKKDLSPEDCFKAVDECGAPMVSIPGGEPLMHPQIDEIVEGLVARKKYIYLCTNALLLKEKLHLFKPSKYLSFSVHVDGQKEHHDFSVCREGGYELALDGIRAAIASRLPRDHQHHSVRWRRSQQRAQLLRRDDGSRRREHDGFARIFLRQGARPEALHGPRPHSPHVPRHAFQSQEDLALQPVAALPRIPDGQAQLQVHALGHADLQHLRMAETLLPAAGWLRRILQRIDGNDGVGQLRHRVGQSAVRQLHGALRLRTFVGGRYVRLAARIRRHGQGDLLALSRQRRARRSRSRSAPGALLQSAGAD